jgi:hypothetical protein
MNKKLNSAAVITGGNATITFEDQGQDFLEWDIKDRKVVASRPFQADLWVGSEVLTFPEIGKTVQIIRSHEFGARPMWIKYPLVKVVAFIPQEDGHALRA